MISVERIYRIDLEIKDTTDTCTAYPSGASRSPPAFIGVRVTRSLVLYVCFVDRCLYFVLFLLANALYVLLRYMDYDCPFGIFKLFILQIQLGLLHTLIYTLKLRVRSGKEKNFMTKIVIVKFHL